METDRTVADVTARKQVEEALRKSEERFRLAAKAGRMYAYEWDVATDIVMRSEEHVHVLGFSNQAEPLTRQQLLATVHPDDRALFVSSVGQATPENPTTHILYRALRPDGSVIWLEKNAKAFFDEQGRMLRMIGMVADITKRKRTEEALRESDERLHLAVRAGRMYAFEWDAQTDVIVRSGECADILNWMDDPMHDSGRHFAASVHPDDREAYAASETVLTPGNPDYQAGYRVLRPDGGVVWLEARGHALFNREGKMLHMVGMVTDVTGRKKGEEALRQREKELIEAQRVAQVGSWQWNPKTDEVVWSRELYRIAGRDPSLPPPCFKEQSQLYTFESWGRLKCAVAEALRTGTPYELDLQMIGPDGSTRWITDRGEALRDDAGRIAWLRGTAQDISERKQAVEALRASEEKFRSVFRDAGVGMVIVSPEGRFLAANDAFCECLGYTEEELLQKTVESVTLAEDWPSFSRKLSETLERGTRFQRVEKHCLHKSGRVITTESTASLIRGPSGEPRYFVGEVLDITERKLAEEALSSVSRRLIEAQEEERARIARELHDDLSQRMALLQISLEQVAQDTVGVSSKTRQQLRNAIRVSSEVSSNLHDLSRHLHPYKLDTLGLVAALGGFCNEFSLQHNLQVRFVYHDVPGQIPKDVALCLFRIVQEALRNVVKHSGGTEAEVELSGHGDRIDLCISDSGEGFSPEQVKAETGLGLISMRERLRLVRGHLSVESEPSYGTRIRGRVPLATRNAGITSEEKTHKAGA